MQSAEQVDMGVAKLPELPPASVAPAPTSSGETEEEDDNVAAAFAAKLAKKGLTMEQFMSDVAAAEELRQWRSIQAFWKPVISKVQEKLSYLDRFSFNITVLRLTQKKFSVSSLICAG
jgi:hypothetical protein